MEMFTLVAGVLLALGSSADVGPGRFEKSLQIGETSRSYVLRVPANYDKAKPTPVVYVLHGFTGTAQITEVYTGMADALEKAGWIGVFPNGSGRPQGWNVGFFDLSGRRANDFEFLSELMDQVEKSVNVDEKRVFVCGHSNGGMMSHALAGRFPDRITAIGVVAGIAGLDSRRMIEKPSRPVSVLMIHGKSDTVVGYDKSSKAMLNGIPQPEAARWWATTNGATGEPQVTRSGDGNVVTEVWRGRGRSEVRLVSVANLTHDWPGGLTRSGRETQSGINATAMLLEFFGRLSR
jgi:polyhydroxybutyrate depolymerase